MPLLYGRTVRRAGGGIRRPLHLQVQQAAEGVIPPNHALRFGGFYCPGGLVESSPGSGTSVLSFAPPCCTTSPTSPTSFISGASHSLRLSSPICVSPPSHMRGLTQASRFKIFQIWLAARASLPAKRWSA